MHVTHWRIVGTYLHVVHVLPHDTNLFSHSCILGIAQLYLGIAKLGIAKLGIMQLGIVQLTAAFEITVLGIEKLCGRLKAHLKLLQCEN